MTYFWSVTGLGPKGSCGIGNDDWATYRLHWIQWYMKQPRTKLGIRKAAFDLNNGFSKCVSSYSLKIQIEFDNNLTNTFRDLEKRDLDEWDYDPSK